MIEIMEKQIFSAEYADWKLIKTRGCVQLIFEIPIEKSDHAYSVLGGMPLPSKSRWVAIAALDVTEASVAKLEKGVVPNTGITERTNTPPAQASVTPGRAPLTLSQQAALTCKDEKFWEYLIQQGYNDKFYNAPEVETNEQAATRVVRAICGVKSRSEIQRNTPAGKAWEQLYGEFTLNRDYQL